ITVPVSPAFCWASDRARPGVKAVSLPPGYGANATRLLLLRAVSPELLEIGPQVLDFLGVAHAREGHASAGNFLHRTANELLEHSLVPGDAGVLHRVRIVEAIERASLAAVDPVERRSELDLRIGPGIVAGRAPFAESRVGLRHCAPG